MGKLLSIVDYMPSVTANRDCILVLEAMLELAQRGEIIAVGVASVTPDGEAHIMLSDADKQSRYLTLSGTLRLLDKEIDKAIETFEGEAD